MVVRHLNVYQVCCWLFVALACDESHTENFKVRTLSSGRQIKIVDLRTSTETDGKRSMVIEYATEADLRDIQRLVTEADQLWPEFQDEVDRTGLTNAVLSPVALNEGGEIVGVTGFSYSRNADKRWCRTTYTPYDKEELCFKR